MKKTIAFLIVFLSYSLHSQVKNYTVIGKVQDSNNEELIGATVVLLNPVDSVLISFASTDLGGAYTMKRVKEGEYKFQITYVGYGTLEKFLKVEGDNAVIDMGIITLSDSTNLIDQVEIVAELTPIIIKKDTIEYNADAYRVRPNATVEDLLKKLPGIEVDDEGKITAQGEEVTKVMVDGKKFFGDDPKMATKNLPAEAVKKVQVFDKKSDRAEFTGISDGETEKTINLELKADKKIGTFGEVAIGYGSSDRFESKLSLNKFNAKYQIASLVNFNNVSNQGFSFSDYSSLMGENPFSRGSDGGSVLNRNNQNNGQTKSLTGGLNLYYEFSRKFNVNTNYFVTYADQFLIKNTDKENVTINQNFFSTENSDKNTLRKQHNVNFNFQLKADSFTRIDFESFIRFNFNNSNSILQTGTRDANQSNISDANQSDLTDSDVTDRNMRLNVTRRLKKPGRILSLSTTLGHTESQTDYFIDRNEYDYLSTLSERLIQQQISENDNNNFNLNTEYKEPLGNKNYLGVSYTRRNYSTDLFKDFFDVDSLTDIRVINNELSANSLNDVLYNRYALLYTKDDDRFNFNANITFQNSQLKWTNGVEGSNIINPSYNYILPSLTFNWLAKSVNIRYNTNINEPSISDLQPIVNNSDPLNIYMGNPSLSPEYTHSLNIRYNFFDNFNFRNFFTFLNLRYTNDKVVNSQTFDDRNIRTIQPINSESSQSANLNLTYATPIRKLKIKSRVFSNASISKTISFINGIQNDVISTRPRVGLELENLKNKVISLVAGSELTFEQNKYSISTTQNSAFTTMRYWSNLLVQFGKGWTLDGNINHTVYSKERFGDNNTLTFLNSTLSKRLYKDRITVAFRVNDILNTGSGITRSVGDTYVEEVYTNAIGRYAMLTLSYKLSAFNPQNNNQRGNMMRMMGR